MWLTMPLCNHIMESSIQKIKVIAKNKKDFIVKFVGFYGVTRFFLTYCIVFVASDN